MSKKPPKMLELLVLTEPDYFFDLDDDDPAHKAAAQLISIFDKKGFVRRCTGCPDYATRFTLYLAEAPSDYVIGWGGYKNPTPDSWFCDRCDPRQYIKYGEHKQPLLYRSNRDKERLRIISLYNEALEAMRAQKAVDDIFYRIVIRCMGRAKGLPDRITSSVASGFFRNSERMVDRDLLNKPVELLLVQSPDKLVQLDRTDPKRKEADKALKRFDQMAFTVKCSYCRRRAAYLTIAVTPVTDGPLIKCHRFQYGSERWLCDHCNPPSAERVAREGFATFEDVVGYVDTNCEGHTTDLRKMVRILAEGKGLRGPVTAASVKALFGTTK